MEGTLRLAYIAGIPVRVHATWLIAFFLITWSLAASFLPNHFPFWENSMYWVTGALGAVFLFASVLVHELAHSIVARARGLPVNGITLFVFGGVSEIQSDREDAADEFLIAIVGPLMSIGLAGVFLGLTALASGASGPLQALLNYLGIVNVALAVFNLVPGFPLDGGRVVRAVLWGATHDFLKATAIATYMGQAVAFLLIVWGVSMLMGGDLLGGVWIALIGWFLNGAAEATRREATARETFRGLRVRDLMEATPHTLTPDQAVENFVREHVLRFGWRALPVTEGDRLLGIVSVGDVKKVDEADWGTTSVAEIMTKDPLYTVSPWSDVTDALRLLTEHDVHQLPVTEGDRLVGTLTRGHLLEHLQLRGQLAATRRRR